MTSPSPKVLPSLLGDSLKHKSKIIESSLSRIYHYSKYLYLKIKAKKNLKINNYNCLLNSIKSLYDYSKASSKKKNIYTRWDNLRRTLVDTYYSKKDARIRKFKRIKKSQGKKFAEK